MGETLNIDVRGGGNPYIDVRGGGNPYIDLRGGGNPYIDVRGRGKDGCTTNSSYKPFLPDLLFVNETLDILTIILCYDFHHLTYSIPVAF